MIKKTYLLLLFLLTCFFITAQDREVLAIMEVSVSDTSLVKGKIAYEYIINEINRLNKYSLVERAALEQAIGEMKIGSEGLIDEDTAAELGRLVGAEQILISSLLGDGNSLYLSMRILAVQTGEVISTAIKETSIKGDLEELVQFTIDDLIDSKDIEPGTAITSEKDSKLEEKAVVKQDEPEKIREPRVPRTPREPGDFSTGFQYSARPVVNIPLGDEGTILGLGFGMLIDGDYRIMQLGPGYLTGGLMTGVIAQPTKNESAIIYPYTYLQIPLSFHATYWYELEIFYFNARISGGGSWNIFSYQGVSPWPDEKTPMNLTFAIYPGLSAGYQISETFGLSAYCDFNGIFFNESFYTALLAGISAEMKF